MRERLVMLANANLVQFKLSYGWMRPWVYFLSTFFRPVMQVLFFGLMAGFVTRSRDISFQVMGNAVQVCALSSLSMVADTLVLDRQNGTLSLVTLTPRGRLFILSGRVLLVAAHGAMVSLVSLLVSLACFGLDASRADWPGLVLIILLTSLSTSSLGAVFNSVGLVIAETNLIVNIMSYLLLVLCGVNFPVSSLPAWAQALSRVLPMSRGISAARHLLAGMRPPASLVLGEAACGLGWLAVGYWLFAIAESRARRDATLELY